MSLLDDWLAQAHKLIINAAKKHKNKTGWHLETVLDLRARLNKTREAVKADDLENAVLLANETGELRYAAVAHQNLGLRAKANGDMPLAYEHMMKSVAIYEQMDIQTLPGTLLNNISGVLIQLGRLDEAERKSLEAIEALRLTG